MTVWVPCVILWIIDWKDLHHEYLAKLSPVGGGKVGTGGGKGVAGVGDVRHGGGGGGLGLGFCGGVWREAHG